jgi:hypothetical protein
MSATADLGSLAKLGRQCAYHLPLIQLLVLESWGESKRRRPCVVEYGIVEVEVNLRRVVQPPVWGK